jgi:hypothetical protein
LIINRGRLARSTEVQWRDFAAEGCAVEEGCVRDPGRRRILLFEVAFANIGRGDLVLGAPEENPALFQWSPCHGHYHLRGAASYQLMARNGRTVLTGRKQAFCFRDNNPLSSQSPDSSGYDCNYMGITAGWEDVYDKSLDCQWLDISGVPAGNYFLKITVNANRLLREGNYGNNATMVPVYIPSGGAAASPPPSTPTPTPAPGPTPLPRTIHPNYRWLFR